MRLSAKTEYAMRIVIRMAMDKDKCRWRSQDLARDEVIPIDYVAQILLALKRAKLVESQRGAHGGFRLAAAPEEISVADVMEATGSSIGFISSVSGAASARGEAGSIIQSVWDGATRVLREHFGGITIRNLAEQSAEVTQRQPILFEI